MVALALSLIDPVLAVQEGHPKRTSSLVTHFFANPKVGRVAWQSFAYGEHLNWSRCAKCVTDASNSLNLRAVCWIGDSGKLVQSGLEIKIRIDDILSNEKSTESKVHQMMEAVQFALDVANTHFIDTLPIKTCHYAGYDLLTAAKAGAAFAKIQAG